MVVQEFIFATMIRRLLVLCLLCTVLAFPARPVFAEEISADGPATPPTPVRAVSVKVRSGAAVIWSGSVSVPDSDTATTTLSASDGARSDIPASSALGALAAADAIAPEFSISNLQYFSSFGSFYVKCVTYTIEQCDNWQYAVGAAYPSLGMDKFLMRAGDTLFVYFGSPRRTTLATSTVFVGESFTATAENYVPSSDSYAPAVGVTISVTQANPDDPYTPLVIATSTADAAGSATFTLSKAGAYAVGIAEDYYYPSISLVIEEAPAGATTTTTVPTAGQGGPSRGGHRSEGERGDGSLNIPAALSFLTINQNADGSFGAPLLSDWAALAFAATPEEEYGETMLQRYLMSAPFLPGSATDYERRAMALMALKTNPYSGTKTDYINKLLSHFDGSQFGDAALVNDDIFALITLLRVGFGAGDEPVKSAAAFILGRQRDDGSWEGNVDLTAAAIQALMPLASESTVSAALSRAREYLRKMQEDDGGFGNSFSTSWALQAITINGDDPSSWQSAQGNSPREYLASLQFPDGGWEAPSSDMHTRVWATTYAIPAALGKSWPSLLASFEKPAGTSVVSGTNAFVSASSSAEAVPAVFATSAPVVLPDASTTTVSDVAVSASSSPAAASTSLSFIPASATPHLPTTAPKVIPSPEAVSSGAAPRENASVASAVPLSSRTAEQAPEQSGAPLLTEIAEVRRANAAAAVAAADSSGITRFVTRFMGWFERALSSLLTLLF